MSSLKIGIVGPGLIGKQLAAAFRDRKPAGLVLHAVAARNAEAAYADLNQLGVKVPVLPLAELAREVDVVVETTRAAAVREVVEAAFAADKTVVIVSAAGLPQCWDLLEQSAATGRGRLIIASGAMPGLDSIRTAAEAGITSLRMRSRFAVALMSHDEHIKSLGIDLSQPLKEPVVAFRGNAVEAARTFPRHFNVGIALQVASGLDTAIEVEMVIDPTISMPIHRIDVETPAGGYTLESRGILTLPTRGSRLVAPSIMACLRRMVAPLSAGS